MKRKLMLPLLIVAMSLFLAGCIGTSQLVVTLSIEPNPVTVGVDTEVSVTVDAATLGNGKLAIDSLIIELLDEEDVLETHTVGLNLNIPFVISGITYDWTESLPLGDIGEITETRVLTLRVTLTGESGSVSEVDITVNPVPE